MSIYNEDTNKPNYYSITPATVRYDRRLTDFAIKLYGEISALCNFEGFCWARNKYFAGLYGIDERTVQRGISLLRDCKHINIVFMKVVGKEEIDHRRIYMENHVVTNLSPPHDKSVTRVMTNLSPINNIIDNNTHQPPKTSVDVSPKHGTRIREDFQIDDQTRKWAREKFPLISDSQLQDFRDAFVDHFVAKAGRDATKRSWQAAFKGWVRNEPNFKKTPTQVPPPNLNGSANERCKWCDRYRAHPTELPPCERHMPKETAKWKEEFAKKKKEPVNV